MKTDQIRPDSQFTVITDRLQKYIDESQVKDGLIIIQIVDAEAAVISCKASSNTYEDIVDDLTRLIPTKQEVQTEDKAGLSKRLRSSMLGRSLVLPVSDKRLQLGSDEDIHLVSFSSSRHDIKVAMRAIS